MKDQATTLPLPRLRADTRIVHTQSMTCFENYTSLPALLTWRCEMSISGVGVLVSKICSGGCTSGDILWSIYAGLW